MMKFGGNLNAVPLAESQWERLQGVVDSGATVSGMGPEVEAKHKVKPSEASKAGVSYQVANGDELDTWARSSFQW